jgi:hypothetical protein
VRRAPDPFLAASRAGAPRPTRADTTGLFLVDLAAPDAGARRFDRDDTAQTGDWQVAAHLQAVAWTTYLTAPHTVRMTDLSMGTPSSSTLLLAFGSRISRTLITP